MDTGFHLQIPFLDAEASGSPGTSNASASKFSRDLEQSTDVVLMSGSSLDGLCVFESFFIDYMSFIYVIYIYMIRYMIQ